MIENTCNEAKDLDGVCICVFGLCFIPSEDTDTQQFPDPGAMHCTVLVCDNAPRNPASPAQSRASPAGSCILRVHQ